MKRKLLLTALILLTACKEPETAHEPYHHKKAPRPQNLDDHIHLSSLAHKVEARLLYAIMQIESANNPKAESHKGAISLMQVMPFNYKRCGLLSPKDLWDAKKNVDCGAQIISEELKHFKGNVTKALQAYNGGRGCVGKCGESVQYSRKVLEVYRNS